jgi:hypothetical protein
MAWWCTPLIAANIDRHEEISEFEASLIYRVSFRAHGNIQRKLVSKKKKKPKETKGDGEEEEERERGRGAE